MQERMLAQEKSGKDSALKNNEITIAFGLTSLFLCFLVTKESVRELLGKSRIRYVLMCVTGMTWK